MAVLDGTLWNNMLGLKARGLSRDKEPRGPGSTLLTFYAPEVIDLSLHLFLSLCMTIRHQHSSVFPITSQ